MNTGFVAICTEEKNLVCDLDARKKNILVKPGGQGRGGNYYAFIQVYVQIFGYACCMHINHRYFIIYRDKI